MTQQERQTPTCKVSGKDAKEMDGMKQAAVDGFPAKGYLGNKFRKWMETDKQAREQYAKCKRHDDAADFRRSWADQRYNELLETNPFQVLGQN